MPTSALRGYSTGIAAANGFTGASFEAFGADAREGGEEGRWGVMAPFCGF